MVFHNKCTFSAVLPFILKNRALRVHHLAKPMLYFSIFTKNNRNCWGWKIGRLEDFFFLAWFSEICLCIFHLIFGLLTCLTHSCIVWIYVIDYILEKKQILFILKMKNEWTGHCLQKRECFESISFIPCFLHACCIKHLSIFKHAFDWFNYLEISLCRCLQFDNNRAGFGHLL